MVRQRVARLAAALFAKALSTATAQAQPLPLPPFDAYPAVPEAVARASAVRLAHARDREFASALRDAAQRDADFAGHYVLARWGCGAGCIMAAAVDRKTGRVVHLPFTVSNWPLDVNEPLEHRVDSRLLMVHGARNEKEPGTWGYVFDGRAFKPVAGAQ